jgi:hypothetical protein
VGCSKYPNNGWGVVKYLNNEWGVVKYPNNGWGGWGVFVAMVFVSLHREVMAAAETEQPNDDTVSLSHQ